MDQEPETQSLHDDLLLNMVPGVGPRLFLRLTKHFGDATSVLDSKVGDLIQVEGIGQNLAKCIAAARMEIDAQQEIDDCRRYNIRLIASSSQDYPAELKQIHDPPPVLYVRGTLLPEDRLAVAIVGSRHVSHYGEKFAAQFARGLVQSGFTIVSGLARGVDGLAHRAALEAGGRTVAVLGSGLMNLYPEEHRELADEICQSGAIISELPLHRVPHAGAFPQRNRLVAGLSLGVLVVEASSRSGALITARHAAEQGREVFALPGRIDSRTSQGCNDLIRDGARLVQSVEDLLEELGPLTTPVLVSNSGNDQKNPSVKSQSRTPVGPVVEIRQPAELKLTQQEQQVLQAVDSEATLVDEIVSRTELPVQRVLATISVLQARRLVKRISGNQIARV